MQQMLNCFQYLDISIQLTEVLQIFENETYYAGKVCLWPRALVPKLFKTGAMYSASVTSHEISVKLKRNIRRIDQKRLQNVCSSL